MGSVSQLIDHQPHLSGPAMCINCGHEWEAVTPVGIFDDLECPECQTMKGVLNYGVVPESTWTCDCGCCLFTLSGETHEMLCWQCGKIQTFGDDV